MAAGKGGMCGVKRSGTVARAYPPPVAAFSPERMSTCFSGMSDEQWLAFMEVFTAQVTSALGQGRWRQADSEKAGGIAMSCPRF